MNVSVTGGPPVLVTTMAVALEVSAPADSAPWKVSAEPTLPDHDVTNEVGGPDVLVVIGLDHGVPVEIDLTKHRYPDVGVVWLAGEPNGREVADAVAWGCSCVVSQDSELTDLVQGVQRAADGQAWTTPDLVQAVMEYMREPAPDPGGGLSHRELEVLELLRIGRSTRQISDELYISTHTTKNHVRRILGKLQAHSRLEAVAIAERRRLIGLRSSGGMR